MDLGLSDRACILSGGSRGIGLEAGGLADQTAEAQRKTREPVLEAAAQALPVGRLAAAHEIAAVIVFLCSKRRLTSAVRRGQSTAVPCL